MQARKQKMMVKIMYVFDEVDSETGFKMARESFKAKGMRGDDIGGRESLVFSITEGERAKQLLQDAEEDGMTGHLLEATPTGDVDNAFPNQGQMFTVEADVVWSECGQNWRVENVKWEVLS